MSTPKTKILPRNLQDPEKQRKITVGVLPPQQAAFVANIVAGTSNVQAAIDAGYAANGAHATANRLLKNPKIREEITKAQQRIAAKTNVTTQWLLLKWVRLYEQSEGENDKKYMSLCLDKLGQHVGFYRADNLQKAPLIQIGHADPGRVQERLEQLEREREAKLIEGERVDDS